MPGPPGAKRGTLGLVNSEAPFRIYNPSDLDPARGIFCPPNRRYPPNFDLFEIAIKELGHMTGECASVLKQRSITRVGVNDELGIGQMTSKEKIYG